MHAYNSLFVEFIHNTNKYIRNTYLLALRILYIINFKDIFIYNIFNYIFVELLFPINISW